VNPPRSYLELLMSEETKGAFSGGDWRAASLRLTAFPSLTMDAPAEDWIRELTGQPPEQITRKRTGQIEGLGLFGTRKLTLNVEPVKIEWQLRPAVEDFTDDNEIATLGSFSQAFDDFLEMMLKWLDNQPFEFDRIAFGCELMIPVENQPDGYKILAPYLHNVKFISEDFTDFLYQINRPRENGVGIEGLLINRLSKWSVGKYVRMAILANGQLMPLSNEDRFFCRLELDINTSQHFKGALPSIKINAVFHELVDLGRGIAIQGDIV